MELSIPYKFVDVFVNGEWVEGVSLAAQSGFVSVVTGQSQSLHLPTSCVAAFRSRTPRSFLTSRLHKYLRSAVCLELLDGYLQMQLNEDELVQVFAGNLPLAVSFCKGNKTTAEVFDEALIQFYEEVRRSPAAPWVQRVWASVSEAEAICLNAQMLTPAVACQVLSSHVALCAEASCAHFTAPSFSGLFWRCYPTIIVNERMPWLLVEKALLLPSTLPHFAAATYHFLLYCLQASKSLDAANAFCLLLILDTQTPINCSFAKLLAALQFKEQVSRLKAEIVYQLIARSPPIVPFALLSTLLDRDTSREFFVVMDIPMCKRLLELSLGDRNWKSPHFPTQNPTELNLLLQRVDGAALEELCFVVRKERVLYTINSPVARKVKKIIERLAAAWLMEKKEVGISLPRGVVGLVLGFL